MFSIQKAPYQVNSIPYSSNRSFQSTALQPSTDTVTFGIFRRRTEARPEAQNAFPLTPQDYADMAWNRTISRRQLLQRTAIAVSSVLVLGSGGYYLFWPNNPLNPKASFVNLADVLVAAASDRLPLKQLIGLVYPPHTLADQDRIQKGVANGLGTPIDIPSDRKGFVIRTVYMAPNPTVNQKSLVIFSPGADGQSDDRDRLFLMWLQRLGHPVLSYQNALVNEEGNSIGDNKQYKSLLDIEYALDADLKKLINGAIIQGVRMESGRQLLPPTPVNNITLAGRSIGGHHVTRVALAYPDIKAVGCFNMPTTMSDALRNLASNETQWPARVAANTIDAYTNNMNAASIILKDLDASFPFLMLAYRQQPKTPVFIAQSEGVIKNRKNLYDGKNAYEGGDLLVGIGPFNSAKNLYDKTANILQLLGRMPGENAYRYVPVKKAGHDTVFYDGKTPRDILPSQYAFDKSSPLGSLATEFSDFTERHR